MLVREAFEGVTENQACQTPEGADWCSLGNLALIVDEPLHVCVSLCEVDPIHEVAEPL
jgi:hypothetical protein